jgi:menaquinone-9 beta-reductase
VPASMPETASTRAERASGSKDRAMSVTEHAVVVVGAGPAGAAAALRIAARRPDLARRTLVVDRRTFPRDKLCAGGLSPLAEMQLARLGAAPAVPSCRVKAAEVRLGTQRHVLRGGFRTVRRKEFDAALLDLVRSRGIAVQEGTRVTAIEQGRAGVSVVTEHAEHRACAVIGADGANSVVRRVLGDGGVERAFALEVLVTADPERDEALADGMATFDFAPIKVGLGGYCWIFPAREGGSALLSCGIAVCTPDCARSGRLARSFLLVWLASQGICCDPASICGHTVIAYDPDARLGSGRVCVAGDAAGIDPFLAEGIPCALGTGIAAADAVVAAIDRGEVDLTRYHERLRATPIGRIMGQRRSQAHAHYRRDALDRYLLAVRLFGRWSASSAVPAVTYSRPS